MIDLNVNWFFITVIFLIVVIYSDKSFISLSREKWECETRDQSTHECVKYEMKGRK